MPADRPDVDRRTRRRQTDQKDQPDKLKTDQTGQPDQKKIRKGLATMATPTNNNSTYRFLNLDRTKKMNFVNSMNSQMGDAGKTGGLGTKCSEYYRIRHPCTPLDELDCMPHTCTLPA